jgi:AGZA family xanthine/uracil permease-like MFS transporter
VSTTAPKSRSLSGKLDRQFLVSESGSTVGTEVRGGFTTYLTMCYILFVNPTILSSVKDHAGHSLPFVQVLTVTALVACVTTLFMAVFTNYPFALAAGLGINAFVAFSLVGGSAGLSWPDAMGVIVTEGLVIFVLVLVGAREAVVNAIPLDLRKSIGMGIGAFIALIGLVNAGVVVKGNGTLVALAPHFRGWPLVIFVVGLMITGGLMIRGVKTALLIGIVLTTVFATIVNHYNGNHVFTDGSAKVPQHWIWPDFGLAGQFSFHFWNVLGASSAIAVVIAVGLSDFFDTAGTVTGVGAKAGLLRNGTLLKMRLVLLIDAAAAALGGLFSASSNTTFIESASGVEAGARTGLASLVVAGLFGVSLFAAPIAGVVPAVATAPILVLVGILMVTLAADIDWKDPLVSIPCGLTLLVMPFTYSITNGVGAGIISYTVLALIGGRAKETRWPMYVVTAIFVWYFVHGVV